MTLRLALAQIDATVGDVPGNREKVLSGIREARDAGADVVVFPEMAIPGYPPEDLLLKPAFVAACERAVDELAPATRGLTAIVGSVRAEGDLFNVAAVL